MNKAKTYKASELAHYLEGKLIGTDTELSVLSDKASQGAVIVVASSVGAKAQLLSSFDEQELALLVTDKETPSAHSLLIVKDTRLALAHLSKLFNNRPLLDEGVHPSAQIHQSAVLDQNVRVAANVVIAQNVKIGAGSSIGAGSVIEQDVLIGENCTLYSNVNVYAGSQIGKRVTLHAGAVIGCDGFGYAQSKQGAAKIYHLGTVVLEDDVEVGANTCIDRATLGETRIGARTKIDNLCQIGHNVTTGTDCLIAGTVAVAGSSSLGRGVILGGGSGVVDHVHIGSGAQIGARSLVTKNIPAGETWAGYPAEPYKKYVRKHYLQNQLERIWGFVKNADVNSTKQEKE